MLDASVTGPAAAVTEQVSGAAQRQAVAHWTRQRMRGATADSLPRSVVRTAVPVALRARCGACDARLRPAVTRAPALPGHGRAGPAR